MKSRRSEDIYPEAESDPGTSSNVAVGSTSDSVARKKKRKRKATHKIRRNTDKKKKIKNGSKNTFDTDKCVSCQDNPGIVSLEKCDDGTNYMIVLQEYLGVTLKVPIIIQEKCKICDKCATFLKELVVFKDRLDSLPHMQRPGDDYNKSDSEKSASVRHDSDCDRRDSDCKSVSDRLEMDNKSVSDKPNRYCKSVSNGRDRDSKSVRRGRNKKIVSDRRDRDGKTDSGRPNRYTECVRRNRVSQSVSDRHDRYRKCVSDIQDSDSRCDSDINTGDSDSGTGSDEMTLFQFKLKQEKTQFQGFWRKEDSEDEDCSWESEEEQPPIVVQPRTAPVVKKIDPRIEQEDRQADLDLVLNTDIYD